ncbi:gliding motility-associated C-terminal domain-containing protein [Hymenobacter sp. UYP22]|uniref:T9SS type B sorting domain-containing protein n=1 Tax=Hymenobacter sp. UYP22 TaxID=3156348 RepID=UPI003390B358
MRKRLLSLIALLALCQSAWAQREYHAWYFGSNAALRFPASGAPAPVTTSAMQVGEGCVSLSDSTGQLQFYSNGERVWNRANQVMVNGSGLGGNRSSTQGVAAVPDPANPQRAYLFTADAVENQLANGLQYNIVDMSRQGGLGEVTAKNVRLSAGPVTERIALVPHANGTDTWVLVHGWGTNAFYAYLLTRTGLQPPVLTRIGAVQADVPAAKPYLHAVGYLRASATGTRLAMSRRGADTELFDFDPATGRLTNDISLPATDDSYGVEFSPDSRLLYLTRLNPTALVQSTLYQYDLLAGSGAAIATSGVPLAVTPRFGGAIQAGPDGRLYLSIDASNYLGVISSPNVRGVGCGYQNNGAYLGGKQAVAGLPNQPARRVQPPVAFTAVAACAGTPVAFTATSSLALSGAAFSWDFGDPATGAANAGTGAAPAHTYSQAGTYRVTLRATHPSLAAPLTVIQLVTVYPLPAPRLPADTLACPPVLLRPRGNWPTGSTFRWSDGSTGPTYLATTAGSYTVTVTSPQGCVGQATSRVQLPAPLTLLLGADTTVCASARWVVRVGPQSPGTTYQWFDGSTAATYVAHGPGTYSVEVRSPTGCTATASRTALDQGCRVFIPNIITPNGDLLNDAFVLQGVEVTDWHLTVFNRWGRQVHDQLSYDNRWQAPGLPAGIYYYRLRNTYSGQQYRGWLEVLRPE